MTKQNNPKIELSKGVFATIVVVSLVVGTISGGVAGLISGTIYSGSLVEWLGNPLGIAINHEIKTKTNQQPETISPTVLDTEEATTQSVSQVTPSVVSIIVTKELQQYYNSNGSNFPFDDFFDFGFPFDDFFFSPNQQQAQPPTSEKQQVGGGTGFIITSDGLILTNRHVVSDTEAEYSVVTNDGETYEAEVIDRDPFNDLAILKIEAKDLPIVTLGDSDQIKVGQTVITIGYSLGEYSNSVTKGIISGIGRDIVASDGASSEALEDVFQTDAAINPGNSGGPLINLAGEVIGINTAVNRSGQLVGFAIPINTAKTVIDSVIENGKIIRAYLGVRYMPLNSQIKEKNNLDYDYGALLVRGSTTDELAVIPGSPADKAGLEENDIILEVNGIKLDEDHLLAKEIARYQPGQVITLKVVHDGTEKTVQVELSEHGE